MRILVIFSLICVAVFATSASYASSDAQGQAGATHPNILYLLTDDMRFDDIQYMPKTQALLRDQGADFGKFYVTTPLCCPSRASGLTGKYAHNTGVRSNKSGFHKFNANGNEADSIAPILHDQGYRTGLFGKYLNAY
jgi:arylsulfatase A-like enzyme